MKLIGSKTEMDMRSELLSGKEALFNNADNAEVLIALRTVVSELTTAYILDFFVDQDSRWIVFLVNADSIVTLYSKPESPYRIENATKAPLQDYKKRFKSRHQQLLLAVAIDLSTQDITNSR